MRPERGNEEVTATLTRFEWNVLLRGGRQLRNKSRKQIEKAPGFVPEPGHTDVNREYISQYNSALNKIEKVWGSPLDHLRD
jgi:hypothetical protein